MSALGIEPVVIPEPSGATAVRGRMAGVCAGHTVVDFFAAIILPLLTVLEGRVHISPAQGAVLIGVGSVASGVIQPVVAWLSDRFDTRLLGTLGLMVAAIAIGSVGYAHTYTQLLLIQILGAGGIGAFHPVAAAAMGQLSGTRRSFGVAVFFTAGMVGGVSGSLFAPFFNQRFGLMAMVWTIAPALLIAGVVAWAIHSIPHRSHTAHASHSALSARDKGLRWVAIGLLYLGNVLRFTVNMALAQLIVRWAEHRTLTGAGVELFNNTLRADSATRSGPLQAAMQAGMGLSGLTLGFLITHKHEKRTLVVVPMLGALAVAALPYSSGVWAYLLTGLCGVGFAGVIPLTIAMAQRLLPHRTSLASGLMMGGAWALAGIGPIVAQRLYDTLGVQRAFLAVAGLLLLAGLVSIALPARIMRQTGH